MKGFPSGAFSHFFGQRVPHLRPTGPLNRRYLRYHILPEPAHTVLAQACVALSQLKRPGYPGDGRGNSSRQLRCPTLVRPRADRERIVKYT